PLVGELLENSQKSDKTPEQPHQQQQNHPDTSECIVQTVQVEQKPIPVITRATPAVVDQGVYSVKWITLFNTNIPIILQNENGPCP
ncbi:hypothetical protein, partial [Escherichia coli]|uniref:hypothetical protein n=1 Tax=Escherichia coli TaxID=562 RepID=UPI001412F4ED